MIFCGTTIECDKCQEQISFPFGKTFTIERLRKFGWSFSKTGLVTCSVCKQNERKNKNETIF